MPHEGEGKFMGCKSNGDRTNITMQVTDVQKPFLCGVSKVYATLDRGSQSMMITFNTRLQESGPTRHKRLFSLLEFLVALARQQFPLCGAKSFSQDNRKENRSR